MRVSETTARCIYWWAKRGLWPFWGAAVLGRRYLLFTKSRTLTLGPVGR